MVDHGIEHLLMWQAPHALGLRRIGALWRHGSAIRSWSLAPATDGLADDPGLAPVRTYAEGSGEGRGTIQDALEEAVLGPAIPAAGDARFRARRNNPVPAGPPARLRHEFGGHGVRRG